MHGIYPLRPGSTGRCFEKARWTGIGLLVQFRRQLQVVLISPPVQRGGSSVSESTWKISIDDTNCGHKQTIVGFGAAVTDATVTSFNTLSIAELGLRCNCLASRHRLLDGPHLSSGGCGTCTGLVTINGDSYTFQTAYYMIAQFSKFMPPGAIVLSGTGSYTYSNGGGIQSIASLNPDGTRSVVIENTFGNDIYLSLSTNSGEEWSGTFLPSRLLHACFPQASESCIVDLNNHFIGELSINYQELIGIERHGYSRFN
ncbi:Endo-1-6-beta-D-glucanase neg1 [Penicillium argentinense]|uniref:Endo-1-6-beta-D-glucanase neg1 n=1 Tax=Penicillium argentinense TaxID=1131581 RepID=A0A9W9G3L6_9EURO|nr:Endo-1-6-beta-D-glucanase neg1 [Penicillium argentinense]KAJ5111506.1 Endo-1-6-beta-D-glucanase neg1 [Penicillium argentinense]